MRSGKTNKLVIQTSDGISFPLLLASPVTRFLAWLIDSLCIMVLLSVCGTIVMFLSRIYWDAAMAIATLSYFVISIGYGMILEWFWRGQTIGKRLLGLRVVDVQGLQLQFSQIVIRNLLRFIDSLPIFYLVGGIASLVNRRSQRLGDIAANTIVTRNPQLTEPDLDQIAPPKYNSLRNYPHLVARLRQRVSPEQAGMALQLLLRRDELDLLARVELFESVAEHFREILRFPPEATEGITDEQYLRNIVDLLFERRKSELKEKFLEPANPSPNTFAGVRSE